MTFEKEKNAQWIMAIYLFTIKSTDFRTEYPKCQNSDDHEYSQTSLLTVFMDYNEKGCNLLYFHT